MTRVEGESRSAAHRRAKRFESVGRRLIDLSPSRLEAAPLSEALREAVRAAKKMSRGSLRRQAMYIGRLMRDLGDEAEAIVDFVEEGDRSSREEDLRQALIEDWRDRLLGEGEPAVLALLELHPDADRQRLRQFLRTAAKESEHGKPPAAARKLFRHLRELLAGDESPENRGP